MPGRHARRAIAAARRHGGDAVDELGLAQRAHRRRTVGAVAGRALDEDRALDLVAAAGVGQQLREQVAVGREVPQVMVRVDDRQIRLEDLLRSSWPASPRGCPTCGSQPCCAAWLWTCLPVSSAAAALWRFAAWSRSGQVAAHAPRMQGCRARAGARPPFVLNGVVRRGATAMRSSRPSCDSSDRCRGTTAQCVRPRIRLGRSGAHHTPFQVAQATSREPSKIMSSATQTMMSRPIHVIQG